MPPKIPRARALGALLRCGFTSPRACAQKTRRLGGGDDGAEDAEEGEQQGGLGDGNGAEQQNSGTGAVVARVPGDTTGDTYKRATRREALATPPATKGHKAKWREASAAGGGSGLGKLG